VRIIRAFMSSDATLSQRWQGSWKEILQNPQILVKVMEAFLHSLPEPLTRIEFQLQEIITTLTLNSLLIYFFPSHFP
jgi:argonaute-like protein implicated in RNA metabolism and viral defense